MRTLLCETFVAYIVGTEPRQNESPLFEVHDSVSRLLEGSEGSISAMISSQGVDMEYKENGPKVGKFIYCTNVLVFSGFYFS